MIRDENSELIEQAELVLSTLDRWGGKDGIRNRIDIIDEFLKKLDSRKEILVQLDSIGCNMYEFKTLLTVDAAAAYLGIHRSRVYRIIKSHGISTYKPPLSKILILTEDLIGWCKQHHNGVTDSDSQKVNQKKKGTKK